MKFSSALVGAFASLALAAPPFAKRNSTASIDTGALNNLIFAQLDLNYLLSVNALDLALFQTLGLSNGLNVLAFEALFNSQTLDVATLLQFQQLSTLLAIAQSGALTAVDLSVLQLGGIDFKLADAIAAVELTQFVDASLGSQIQAIADGGE